MNPTTHAGANALAMYRITRRRRRRRIVWAFALLVTAAAAAVGRLSLVVVFVLAGAGAAGIASVSIGSLRDPDRWRRGAEGERRTADLLDALPSRRWAVWHDLRVPGSRANIDHIVLGRTGVWVVDTKTTRGEVRCGWRSVRLGGRRLDTAPVRWEADVVAERLEDAVGERVGRPVSVRPIVAVHSSGIRTRGVRVAGVPVVRSDRLAARIRKGRRRIGRADRALIRRALEEGVL